MQQLVHGLGDVVSPGDDKTYGERLAVGSVPEVMYDPGVVLVVRVKGSDRDDLGVLWFDRLFDGLVSFEGGSGVDVQSAVGVHLVAQTLPAADEIVVVDRTEPELVDLVDDQVVGFLDDVLVEFVASVPFGEQRIEQGIELPVAVEHDDLLVAQRVVDVVEQGTRFSGAWQPLDEDERTGRVGQFSRSTLRSK